jgi:hypothetical protein
MGHIQLVFHSSCIVYWPNFRKVTIYVSISKFIKEGNFWQSIILITVLNPYKSIFDLGRKSSNLEPLLNWHVLSIGRYLSYTTSFVIVNPMKRAMQVIVNHTTT